MTDYDMRCMRETHIISNNNVKDNIKEFIKDVKCNLNRKEVWRLNSDGYNITKHGSFLTTSKKKTEHPYLHYGSIYINNGTIPNFIEEDERLNNIDISIDNNLRNYSLFNDSDLPVNAIFNTDNTPDNITIGSFKQYFNKYNYIKNNSDIITDGDVIFTDKNYIDFEFETFTSFVCIKNYTYIISIIYKTDHKLYTLDSDINIYLK